MLLATGVEGPAGFGVERPKPFENHLLSMLACSLAFEGLDLCYEVSRFTTPYSWARLPTSHWIAL